MTTSMHPVALNEGEIVLLKEARAKRDWKILPTFKLKYVYQRLVALPRNDMTALHDIAKEAAVRIGKADRELVQAAQEVFGGD